MLIKSYKKVYKFIETLKIIKGDSQNKRFKENKKI